MQFADHTDATPTAINHARDTILLSDGRIIPVVGLLDDEGDECDSYEDAVVIVAGTQLYGFWSIPKDMFSTVMSTLH